MLPPAPPRGRVTRRTSGHLLAGVASGIADHLRVDPVLVRIGFVVLGLWPFPGFGLLLYLALAFLLPAEDERAPRARAARVEPDRGIGFYIGVALLIVAILALLGGGWMVGAGPPAGGAAGLLVPLLLIGVGVALWVSDRDSAPSVAASSTSAPPPSPPSPPPSARPEPSAVAPRPTEPRSPLGRMTFGASLTVVATLWGLQVLGVVTLPVSSILAAGLAVLGVGLLVGSVVGRARWLAWIAAPLALAVFATAVIEDLDLPLQAGVDDRVVRIVDAPADGVIVERLGAGRLVVDLTGVSSGDLDGIRLDASLGAGELEVLVAEDVRLVGRARLEVGELSLVGPGRSQGRGGLAIDETVDVGPSGGSVLDADLRVGAGQISVRPVRVTSTEEPPR